MADERPDLSAVLEAALARGDPPHLALMHLLGASRSEGEARQALAESRARHDASAAAIDAVTEAWRKRPGAFATIREVLAVAQDGDVALRGDAVDRWRTAFDRIAMDHPEAGVALYALGDPALLAAASREIVASLVRWGDLRAGMVVLDLGCGIGRLSGLMAQEGAVVLGVDLSGGMLAEAIRRHGGPGLLFAQVSGRDLQALADRAFDLVVAADVFPYLVDAGGAAGHLRELARVLRPGGRLVIANFSYRGDPGRDEADLRAWSTEAGLALLEPPSRPFASWDGWVARLCQA